MHLLTPSSPGVFQLCLWSLTAPGYLGGGCHASHQPSDASTLPQTNIILHKNKTNWQETYSKKFYVLKIGIRSLYVDISFLVADEIFINLWETEWNMHATVLANSNCMVFWNCARYGQQLLYTWPTLNTYILRLPVFCFTDLSFHSEVTLGLPDIRLRLLKYSFHKVDTLAAGKPMHRSTEWAYVHMVSELYS